MTFGSFAVKNFYLNGAQHPVGARTNFGTRAAFVQLNYWKKRVANLRCFDRLAYSCPAGRNDFARAAASPLDFIKPPADDFRDALREIPLPVPLVPEPV